MNKLITKLLLGVLLVLGAVGANAQIAVTVTGNTNTTPVLAASYPSLALALTDLNNVTAMTGPVSFALSGSETAPATGFTIGSATLNPVLSATNTLTFTGPATINAGVGTATPSSAAPDGMLKLSGADYVTISNMTFTDGNAANPATMEFGVALFKRAAGDGCNNNTIQNCTFNMQRINNANSTAPMIEGAVGILVINSTATAATTSLTPTNGGTLTTNGTNSGNKFYTNTINSGNYGIGLSGYAASAGVGPTPTATTFLGDLGNDIGGTAAGTGNNILNFGGGAAANPSAGIRANNQWSINIQYNTVNNNTGAGVNHATTFRGIYAQAGTSANATISNNTVTIQSGATTSTVSAIDNAIGSTAASNTVSINSNIIKVAYTTATTGAMNAILNSSTATTININSNDIQGVASTNIAGTGAMIAINAGSSGGTLNTNLNTISNISRSTATSGTFRGIVAVTPPTVWNCLTNTIDGLSFTNASSTGSITGIYNLSGATVQNINGNIVRNLSTPTTGTLTGILNNTTTGTHQCKNNQIYNFSTTAGGAGGGTFAGIAFVVGSLDCSNNIIYSLNSTGTTGGSGGTINGIQITGGTTQTINNNAIYDLSTTSTNATVAGINIGGGTTNNIYDNLIGDLRAINSTGNVSISGILLSSGTTNNIYHNTVNIASTTTSVTTFGTSAIYFSSSSPINNLRNNVFVNTSAPGPTGGFTAAIRYTVAPTSTNFPATNNNNFYYGGSPAANRVIYCEGSSAAPTNGQQTIANYKTYINTTLPVPGREAASVSEVPNFVSTTGSNPVTNFLKYNTGVATQIEQGGGTGTGVATDYAGTTRCPGGGCPGAAATPDLGAWELNGIAADLTGPSISYALLGNDVVAPTRAFSAVTITDPSGVNGTAGTRPRCYYKLSTNTNAFNDNTNGTDGWKWVEANGSGSPFDFTIDYSLLFGGGGVSVGNIVQYFVVAQDNAGTPNVGINAGSFAATPASVALTGAAFPIGGTPNSYLITATISGTITVPGTYPSLTLAGGAFEAINNAVVNGNINIEITGDLTSETGLNALNAFASPHTVKIYPTGSARIVSGALASNGLIRLNGADRVTIDGSIGGTGTDRSLTITNTSTTSPTAVSLVSLGVGAGAVSNTVKNCNISTGVSAATGYGIAVGGSTPGTSGADNDDVTIQNNNITVATVSIYAVGTASVSSGGNDNLLISGNTVNSNTTIQNQGIQVGNGLTGSITGNTVSVESSGTVQPVGISIETGFVSSSITNNIITKSLTTATGGYGGRGITVGTGTASSNLTIANNVIYGVNGSNWSSFGASSSMGIGIGVLGGGSLTNTTGGVNLYFNSVSMTGSMGTASTSALTTAIYLGSGTSALNIRDNAFSNTQVGTNASQKNYAIYSAVANTAFTTINLNDYWVSNTFNAGSALVGFLTSDRATLANWQTASGQDANSISANPAFQSATDLRPSLGSPLIGAANNAGTGVTTDILGVTRSAGTPPAGATIGAYENAVDAAGPAISYTLLTNTASTANRPFTAVAITDPSGVNGTAGTRPRVYYKRSTDANTFADNTSGTNGWKWVEASGATTPFDFTIDYSLLNGGTGVTGGQTVQYFVVAQDNAGTPNVGINSGTFAATPASVALTSGAFPIGGTINSYNILVVVNTFPYCQDFEGAAAGWSSAINSGSANNWVIGTPAKTQIAAAHGGTKAYITLATGNYSNSHDAYIVTPQLDFTAAAFDPVVSFWQNFKTEAGWDAGVLEYSTNGGSTWTKVDATLGTGGTFNTTNSTGWYNSSSSSGPIAPPKWSNTSTAYTGHASGWIKSTSTLIGLAGQANVILRWRFGSDSGGADEGWAIDDVCITTDDISAPAITYTALSGTCATTNRTLTATITDASGVPTAGALMPRIYYKKNADPWFSSQGVLASGSGTNGTWTFTIVAADMGGVVSPDVISYYVIAQDVAGTPNIGSNPSAGLVATDVNTVTTPPTTPNTYNIQNTLAAGTYTVGGAGTYPTLTAAIAAYNTSCLGGAIVFELLDPAYAETGAMTIAANADASATNTLTIRPATGVTAAVTATAASAPVLKILGKYVTIDGSNNGSASRDLTITNGSTTSPNVVLVGSTGVVPITNVTVKNCNLVNGDIVSSAVLVGDGTTIGNAGYFNNIVIQNNSIQKGFIGLYCRGVAATGNGTGLNITTNDLSASGANANSYIGIYVEGVDGATVQNNIVGNFDGNDDEDDRGIWIASGTKNSTIKNNTVSGLKYLGVNGYGAHGIVVTTGLTAANVQVSNNMIADLTGDGWAYTGASVLDNPIGIVLSGTQTGISVYHNSINLSGNTLDQTDAMSMGIYLGSGSVANIRDNMIVNNLGLVGATGYGAVGVYAVTSNTQFAASDFNNYSVNPSGSGNKFIGKISGTNASTIAAWRTATGSDVNSINVNPSFVSATDLHLFPTAQPVFKAGTPIAGITTDIDGNNRNLGLPTLGADEIYIPNLWAGTVSTVWDGATTGNWDDGTVPAAFADVTIPFGVPNMPAIAGATSVNNLSFVGSGATLSLNGQALTITGAVTGTGTLTGSSTSDLLLGGTTASLKFTQTNAGTRSLNNLTLQGGGPANVTLGSALDVYGTVQLVGGATLNMAAQAVTLKSNATNTARIADLTGQTLTGASNVTMERFIKLRAGGDGRAYRLLTPTVNTTGSINANWMEGGMNTAIGTNVNPVPNYGTQITGAGGNANGFDKTQSNAPSLYNTANGTTPIYTAIGSTSGNLNALTGYFMYVRGDRSMDMTIPLAPNMPTSATTLRATGSILQGTQTSFTNAYAGSGALNLVTNPYPSPIDWSLVQPASSGITGSYTYWDANIGTRGGFATVTTAGVSTPATSATQMIQSGQAFFVESNGAVPAVSIQESHKVAGNNNDVFLVPPPPVESFRTELYFTEPNGFRRIADGAIALYDNGYSASVDAKDSKEINNWDENIAIAREGKHLAIESRPVIAKSDDLPIFMNNMKKQAYEFEFTPLVFTNTSLKAELVDNFLGTRTLLSVTDPTVVAFTITDDPASKATDRFKVVFGQFGNPQGIDAITIKASQKNDGVQVDWTSKTETDMVSYEVERSTYGTSFVKANTTAALGNSSNPVNYNWFDASPNMGSNFYRIKGIDKAGNVRYSDAVRVLFGKGEPSIVVYPNPLQGNTFKIDMYNLVKGTYTLNLYSMTGQLVYTAQLQHDGSQATKTINLNGEIGKGSFQLQLIGGSGFKTTQRIIKN